MANLLTNKYFCIAILILLIIFVLLYFLQKKSCSTENMATIRLNEYRGKERYNDRIINEYNKKLLNTRNNLEQFEQNDTNNIPPKPVEYNNFDKYQPCNYKTDKLDIDDELFEDELIKQYILSKLKKKIK